MLACLPARPRWRTRVRAADRFVQAFLDAHGRRAQDAGLARTDRERSVGLDSLGQVERLGAHGFRALFDVIDESERVQSVDRNEFAGKRHFHQHRLRKHPQQRHAPRRTTPHLGFSDAALRTAHSDPQIAIQRQHHAAGGETAGHGRDQRHGHIAHLALERVAYEGGDVATFACLDGSCFLQVHAGAERAAVG
jgi:hypothetical protein